MIRCRICSGTDVFRFSLKQRNYIQCRDCGSICTATESFVTVEKQKERYDKHHNSLSDEGYAAFLKSFIQPVLEAVSFQERNDGKGSLKNCGTVRILDYGSGPEPALCQLMQSYTAKGMLLPEKCEIRGWDPFFAPDTAFFEEGADLVTCLEVAEHFEAPLENMKKLSGAVKKGGYAAIGTMLLPEAVCGSDENAERDVFKNWWYRSDSTHVAFYTLEGLRRCAEAAGLEFLQAVTERAFLFRKTV